MTWDRPSVRRSHRTLHAWWFVVACVLLPRVASADLLDYAEDIGGMCPTAAAFLASVRARTERAHFDGTPGRTVRVRLRMRATGEPFVGSLVIDVAGVAEAAREVDGTTCSGVADALSLILSLAIDENARLTVDPLLLASPAALKSEAVAQAPRMVTRDEPPPAPSRPREGRGVVTGSVDFEAIVAAGAPPSAMLGAALGVGLERHTATPTLLVVAKRVGLRVGLEKTLFGVSGPTADFVRATSAVTLCPLSFEGSGFELAPCAGFALGAVSVEGEGAAEPSRKLRWWSHVEAGVEARHAIGANVFVQSRLTVEVPLTRDEFVFRAPDVFVHRAAPVGGALALGAGMRL